MANIKLINTVDAQEWEVVYEVDFTELTGSVALNTDAQVTLSGPHAANWICKFGSNTNYIDRVQIVNGTGLQFEFVSGEDGSHLYQATNTAPRLMALASDIIPGLTADDVIEFQILATAVTLDDNYQFLGLHMNDGDMTSAGEWIHNSAMYVDTGTGGDANDMLRQGNGTMVHTCRIETGATLTPVFRGLRWNAGSCGFSGTSKFTDEFISPRTTTDFLATGVGAAACTTISPTSLGAAPVISITNGYIGIHGAYALAWPATSTGNAFTATFTKFRALKRK